MSKIKSLLKLSRVRVTLALVVIGLGVVFTLLYAPKEQDPNIGLTADPAPPTVGITNLVGSLKVNRSTTYRNVTFTVTQVQEATAFSDDRKRNGTYTVRVEVHAQPGTALQSPTGMDYASLVRLQLTNGETIAPKLISLLPLVMPQQAKDGYFDFPVSTNIPLPSLTLRIGDTNTIGFSE